MEQTSNNSLRDILHEGDDKAALEQSPILNQDVIPIAGMEECLSPPLCLPTLDMPPLSPTPSSPKQYSLSRNLRPFSGNPVYTRLGRLAEEVMDAFLHSDLKKYESKLKRKRCPVTEQQKREAKLAARQSIVRLIQYIEYELK